jgi:hypothetical protein
VNQSKCITSFALWGVTKIGKSEQAQEAACYVNGVHGKKLRLVGLSPGGVPVDVQAGIETGIIEYFYALTRTNLIESLHHLSLGGWPSNLSDPLSPILRPSEQKDWNDVGAVFFDGALEGGMSIIDRQVSTDANPKSQENPALGLKSDGSRQKMGTSVGMRVQDGDMWFGAPDKGHYGFSQSRLRNYITQSSMIVDKYVFWTFLDGEGKSDESIPGVVNMGAKVYGPGAPGTAITSTIPTWFENTFHLVVAKGEDGTLRRRMYLRHHFSDDGILCLAGIRNSRFDTSIPDYLEGEKLSVGEVIKMLGGSVEIAKQKLLDRIKYFKGGA